MRHVKSFKLYENLQPNKLVPIATNEINWSWEYDSTHIEATVFFDPTGSNELFLSIKRVHTKHGIGRDQFTTDLVSYEPIGTIDNPDLRKVQTLLTKYKYSDSPTSAGGGGFKRQWTDMTGDSMSLGKIITNSRYLKMTNLKNRLAKKHTPKTEPMKGINIMKYGRGYAVYGQGTKDIKDELKEIGARFNFRLTHPETGEKFVGWVISPNKLVQVKDLIGDEKIQESSEYTNKEEIQSKYSNFQLFKLFPKMYETFFELITEDDELEYETDEDKDLLQLDFAEAALIYIMDTEEELLGVELPIEVLFLKNYLRYNEFESTSTINDYDDLSENSAIIYDNLDQRLEIIFWTLIEENITKYLK